MLIVLLLCSSCSWAPRNSKYRSFYSYLGCKQKKCQFSESDYYVIFLVSARHLDYFDSQSFLKTLAKHPNGGSLNGDVGHAWIYLQGKGKIWEGGHSGELGISEPKYLDGVMDLLERGDDNPIRYLHRTLRDGFFQPGSGGHCPTWAVKVDLTLEEFEMIRNFIDCYDFTGYSLTERQCVSFAAAIARLAGIDLETKATMSIAPYVYVGKQKIILWKDPFYSILTLHSTDILEKSLMQLVKEGKGQNALDWYLKRCKKRQDLGKWVPWPGRIKRVLMCP